MNLEVSWAEAWTMADTLAAHGSWHQYVAGKRAGILSKRPMADILIGAFASRFEGILTRNIADFSAVFPSLRIEKPSV